MIWQEYGDKLYPQQEGVLFTTRIGLNYMHYTLKMVESNRWFKMLTASQFAQEVITKSLQFAHQADVRNICASLFTSVFTVIHLQSFSKFPFTGSLQFFLSGNVINESPVRLIDKHPNEVGLKHKHMQSHMTVLTGTNLMWSISLLNHVAYT